MRLFACPILFTLALLSLPAWPAPVSDLYQVREAVSSQQPQERDAALQRALDTLILRLTGQPSELKNAALAGLRENPQQIISRYGYEGEYLRVDFDAVSTDRTLQQAGLSLWGVNRPAVLVWWLNETDAGSNLLGDAQDSAEPLLQAAQHRGLPLRLPLADLNEQLLATEENLTTKEPQVLREASERYAADALLAVRARQNEAHWQAQWQLWLGAEREQGTAQGDNPAALADAVLLSVSERLAPRFAVAPGTAVSVQRVEILGADLSRYAALQRVLEPFAAQLHRVQADRLVYQVKASAEQLRAQLALIQLHEVPADELMQRQPSGTPTEAGQLAGEPVPAAPGNEELLRFRW
jgi:hypothetical protein